MKDLHWMWVELFIGPDPGLNEKERVCDEHEHTWINPRLSVLDCRSNVISLINKYINPFCLKLLLLRHFITATGNKTKAVCQYKL